MTLKACVNRFRSVKHSKCAMSWNAWDILTALFPVLHVFWQSNKASAVEKYRFRTPRNGISETLNSKLSLIASALKNLCLWCEFQSCLLFIISLPLKNFLTALILVKDLVKNIITYFRDWPVVDRVCPILPSSNLQTKKSHLKKIWIWIWILRFMVQTFLHSTCGHICFFLV